MRDLLLEIHCEEIPARFLEPLSTEFADAFLAWLRDNLAVTPAVERFHAPRKLAWRVKGIPEQQPDQREVQVGPPQRMCLDAAGAPTQTGLKFAEKWGVPFDQVLFEQPAGKKEPVAVATLVRPGRPTLALLAEVLPRLVAGLHVPKAMRWGNSTFEFVRPIRNVLALFGTDVVPFELDGVAAGATTRGHRLYHMDHPDAVPVPEPSAYEAALEAAGVVVSFEARRSRLAQEMDRLAAESGGRVVADEELLSTLALIVEVPRIIKGEFPASFLDLPKEVLVTSLKEHQKAFCVEDASGALLPCFLTAANRADDPAGFLKSGNEWVLRARLYDARFFFSEDRRQPLADRMEKLKNLTFQRELGSYFDKTQRMMALSEAIAGALGLDGTDGRLAAQYAKCDLVTLMVGEFPELQGIMGGEYLRREGAHEKVWQAVKEHYRPDASDAPIPGTPLGGVVALADKLDTVAGCFSVGIIPTGSKDPLALRRAGQGIVRILFEMGWNLNPMRAAALALDAVGERATKPRAETLEALEAFFRDRVAYQIEQAGYPAPVRRAALAAGWTDLVDLKARCEALAAFGDDPRFASLAQSAKRISNILKDETPSDDLDAACLQQAEEKALAERLPWLESHPGHATLLAALADLAGPLEAFFTAVMVKCEDPRLRAARLSLLHRLRRAFLRVADFSQWQ
ncbi:glycine--tRNA ligase subunit beta [Mesoterricola sediminis]|uniref:Glycine--tRNA ligase beta subunit n=1 Tax=Mesoterricola sediminis TaxID=2927980 RepID=A0AA48KCL4_9BACT|nr:glycine--tRNA ligase subunit beta [Mesoterricola sediminis]BDU77269.1 glycine--tRNA ligase beta subunit [Mesoterricola sediminis]